MGKPTLVAVFYNEETKLPGYFRNVSGVAGRMVVVDCGSTDRTAAICRSTGAEVIPSPYRYFEQNVNRALKLVKNGEWVLILDADERLSQALKKEIKQAIRRKDTDVFYIRRINYLFGGFSTKSSINTFLPRLFRKGCVRWEQEMPHEKLVVEGRQARLSGTFYHYAYPDLPSYIRKMEDYLCAMPSEYSKKGQEKIRISERGGKEWALLFGTHGLRRLFLYPIAATLNSLVRRRLALDGMRGVIFSICTGTYAFFEEAIWWEKSSRSKSGSGIDWSREYPDQS